jgi:GH24 family phage-related lysozyme (muramidase)
MQIHAMSDYVAKRNDFLKLMEGISLGVYLDTKGFLTIGIGFNLNAPASRAVIYQRFGIQARLRPAMAAMPSSSRPLEPLMAGTAMTSSSAPPQRTPCLAEMATM